MLFKLLVALAALCAAVALAWMLFLPALLTSQLRSRTGFDVTVQSLAVNPFTGKVAVHGLVISNPPTFPVHDFIEVREFSANLEIFTLFSSRLVFTSMVLDVPTVTLVTRDEGESNAVAFEQNLGIGRRRNAASAVAAAQIPDPASHAARGPAGHDRARRPQAGFPRVPPGT